MRGRRNVAARNWRALLTIGVLVSCSGGGGSAGSEELLMGSGGGGGGDKVHRGEVVAKLELVAPEEDIFFVRATLPVPPGTLPAGSSMEPLAVVTYPGTTAPTQVNTVTSYPDPEDGASVVEVIARVRRGPKVAPGDTMTLFVAEKTHAPGRMLLKGKLRNMLQQPGALQLSTRDVFGNLYTSDLFAQVLAKDPRARLMRDGGLVREYAVHEVLRPVSPKSGGQGTLDHMMGVHAYVTAFDQENWFLLDLHVHNGMDGLDPDSKDDTALDELLFKELALRLPDGWKATVLFDHPSLGQGGSSGGHWTLPLVKKMSNGKLHSMPRQARFVRRLAIYPEGEGAPAEAMLRGERLAYCRPGRAPNNGDYWSWWNADTARWLPQAHRLPELTHIDQGAIEAEVVGNWQTRGEQLAQGAPGSYPFKSAALGWAQPWGVPYGGMTGGDEVWITDGLKTLLVGKPEGYCMAQLTLRCYLDRQPTALYSSDGRPTKVEDLYVGEGFGAPYVKCSFYIQPSSSSDPFGFNDAPTFQISAAENQGLLPGYRDELESWMPIDIQHYIRFTRNLKTLVWMSNDSIAKDQLVAAAEIFRLGFHPFTNGAYGYVQGSGLRSKLDHVAEFPGQGVDYQRSEGWGMDVAVAAYLVGDQELRERLYPWFETVAQLVEDGQSDCTGNVMATAVGKLFDGKYLVRYTGHTSYADNSLRGMQKSVFEGVDEDRAERLAQVLVGNVTAGITPPFWNEEAGQPWSYVGIGPTDAAEGEFCYDHPDDANAGYTTNQKSFSSLAYAYEETGDDLFLFRAAQILGGGDLLTRLENQGLSNLETFSALLALVQEQPEQ